MYLGPQRKLNRWFGFDYKMPGLYFVTTCVKNKDEFFGVVKENKMVLNDIGRIVKQQWLWLAENFKYIKLDEWVVMPNHLHGIIEIVNIEIDTPTGTQIKRGIMGKRSVSPVGNGRDRSLQVKPLPGIIGAFKTTSSKLIHQHQNNFNFAWQKSFHDRVIRDDEELNNIRYYIKQNPSNWHNDKNNPINISGSQGS